MQSPQDIQAVNNLIAALSDRRVDYHEVAKLVSIQPLVSQEMLFEFILEYIRYYAFMHDTGSFPNGNMEIAKTMSNIRYALDDITPM